MELKPEQIQKFIELHKDCAGFKDYAEEQVREIANGVANYYLTLFNIHQRVKKEGCNLGPFPWCIGDYIITIKGDIIITI